MMKSLMLTAVFVIAFVTMFAGQTAFAANPYSGVDCSGSAKDSALCKASSSDPLTGPGGAIVKIANIIAYLTGAAAIIMLVIAAIRFISSGGDPGNVKKARDTILYVLIGVAVVVLARSIIVYIIFKV
jgi:hypothetical protein